MPEEQLPYSIHFQTRFESMLYGSKSVKKTALTVLTARYQVSKSESKLQNDVFNSI